MVRTQSWNDASMTRDAQARPVRLEPWDEHNRRLVENVHPPDWTNPTPRKRYQLVVVGGGTGGLVTAAIAAALGAKVALIERHLMGGDCLNVGCVPSKAMLRAARAWSAARQAHERFAGPGAGGEGDFAAVMERMRRIRAGISPADSAARFRDLGVDVFFGQARFTGPDTLEVNGDRLHFRRAVIAAGSRPIVPAIRGLKKAGFHTNETVFSLTERPQHLLVIGGGAIGAELAQAFARLGSRVTLIEQGGCVLPEDDRDAARVVEASLVRDGITVITGAEATAVETTGGQRSLRYTREGRSETVTGDTILLAVGRCPNVEGLGLEEVGVRYDRRGIEVDDRLRTTSSRIYAVGDICSQYPFTHVADAHARLVVRNALFYGRGRASELVIPWVIYTSPELAHVGITPRDVHKRADEIETITIPLAEVDRAGIDGEEEGFFRVHLRKGSDRILGATLVAEHAGEIISQITQAMVAGVGLGKLGETIFPYPTQAEAIRKAADQWRRRRLTPLAKSLFRSYFRVVR